MTPADLLLKLEGDLKTWVARRKGYLSLAGDPGDVLEALTDAPRTFRVVLGWAGDDDQTGQPEAGIVDQQIEVWLIKARGLKLKPGDHLVRGETPLLDLLSDLRATIRKIEWPDGETSITMLYKGAKQFEPEIAMALPTTGYKLSFELTTALESLV